MKISINQWRENEAKTIDFLSTNGYTQQDMAKAYGRLLTVFVIGITLGFYLSIFFPKRIEGKTIQDWYSQYQTVHASLSSSQQDSQLFFNAYKDLIACIQGVSTYQDYYNGNSYIVNDVSDIHQCILDEQDTLTSQQSQKEDLQQQAQQDSLLNDQGQQ